MADRKWDGTTYGNSLMHHCLIKLLKYIDIRIAYIFSYIFVIPPCLFRSGFKPIYHYFRERWGYGPIKAFLKTYQNHCMFSQVVIDRFAMYAGKHFKVEIDGLEHFQNLTLQEPAFVQLSSHIGNYEVAGYTLPSYDKPINAVVFYGEKQTVMENRMDMFAGKNIRMIYVKKDMGHLFLIDHALQQGEIVSMPADRIFGSQKSVSTKLLGAEVKLPLGPFSVATMRGLHVLAVNVMKSTTNCYKIYVTPLDYDREAPRKHQINQLVQGYAAELERILTMYPTQWYNYFEYWKS